MFGPYITGFSCYVDVEMMCHVLGTHSFLTLILIHESIHGLTSCPPTAQLRLNIDLTPVDLQWIAKDMSVSVAVDQPNESAKFDSDSHDANAGHESDWPVLSQDILKAHTDACECGEDEGPSISRPVDTITSTKASVPSAVALEGEGEFSDDDDYDDDDDQKVNCMATIDQNDYVIDLTIMDSEVTSPVPSQCSDDDSDGVPQNGEGFTFNPHCGLAILNSYNFLAAFCNANAIFCFLIQWSMM